MEKLSNVGFIIETKYPTWMANVVLVRRANNKWRICVDFTDLNVACPKDSYLLSDIDRLIDISLGYCVLSFMGAYSRYNQIKMDPLDSLKIAFILNQGKYYYNVIPSILKNVGAAY